MINLMVKSFIKFHKKKLWDGKLVLDDVKGNAGTVTLRDEPFVKRSAPADINWVANKLKFPKKEAIVT